MQSDHDSSVRISPPKMFEGARATRLPPSNGFLPTYSCDHAPILQTWPLFHSHSPSQFIDVTARCGSICCHIQVCSLMRTSESLSLYPFAYRRHYHDQYGPLRGLHGLRIISESHTPILPVCAHVLDCPLAVILHHANINCRRQQQSGRAVLPRLKYCQKKFEVNIQSLTPV